MRWVRIHDPSQAAPRASLNRATFREPKRSPELDPALLRAFVAAVRNRHSHRTLHGSQSAIATICSSSPTRYKPRPTIKDIFVSV